MKVELSKWCEVAGVEPAPKGYGALGRGLAMHRAVAWRIVRGERQPSLGMLDRISRALRVPVGAVAEACLAARADYLARQEVERARKEAESR